jgi:hypothetical protein
MFTVYHITATIHNFQLSLYANWWQTNLLTLQKDIFISQTLTFRYIDACVRSKGIQPTDYRLHAIPLSHAIKKLNANPFNVVTLYVPGTYEETKNQIQFVLDQVKTDTITMITTRLQTKSHIKIQGAKL